MDFGPCVVRPLRRWRRGDVGGKAPWIYGWRTVMEVSVRRGYKHMCKCSKPFGRTVKKAVWEKVERVREKEQKNMGYVAC
jgi:hypothetical protein